MVCIVSKYLYSVYFSSILVRTDPQKKCNLLFGNNYTRLVENLEVFRGHRHQGRYILLRSTTIPSILPVAPVAQRYLVTL